jgi:beta-galactosidase
VRVAGAGELAAMDSADVADLTPVAADHRSAFEGRVLAIVRSGGQTGTVTVRASAPGLEGGEATITVR